MSPRADVSRFWTQFEAWLSMQHATPSGLKSAVGTKNERHHIVPIQNAAAQAEMFTKMLIDQWSGKTTDEAHDFLSKPDVTVTNQSDKDNQLPKIKLLDAMVQGAFQAIHVQMQHQVMVMVVQLQVMVIHHLTMMMIDMSFMT